MSPSRTIPLAIPAGRRALAQLYIDLTLAFHATTVPVGETPGETDANQALVAVAVMLGHAEGNAMNATQLASCLHMPRTSILRRLEALIERGLIKRVKTRYYLAPKPAQRVPHRDRFELILSRAIAVLGPRLSKTDK
jgi:biotin operon repressor